MTVQKRIVEAFSKGEWGPPLHFRIPEDVTIVEYVDIEAQQREVQMLAMKIAHEKQSLEYNPMAKKATLAPNIMTPEEELARYKPEGSKINFSLHNLDPDTVYETRVCFHNLSGVSVYSMPSHRAKTNRAEVPGQSMPPRLHQIGETSCVIILDVPGQGGAPIVSFTVEQRDMNEGGLVKEFPYVVTDKYELLEGPHIELKELTPGSSYQFKSRAENIVGKGPFSLWCDEIELPEPDVKLAALKGRRVEVDDTPAGGSEKVGDEGTEKGNDKEEKVLDGTGALREMDIKLPPSSTLK